MSGQLTARKSDAADARAPELGGSPIFPRSFAPGAKIALPKRPQDDAFSPRTFRPRPLQFDPVISGPCFWTLISHPDYFTHGHQLSVMTVSVVSASSVRQSPPTYLYRNLSVPAREPATDGTGLRLASRGYGQSDTLEARAKLTSDSALELGGLPRLPAPRTLQEG